MLCQLLCLMGGKVRRRQRWLYFNAVRSPTAPMGLFSSVLFKRQGEMKEGESEWIEREACALTHKESKLSCEHISLGEFAFDSVCIQGEVLTFSGSRCTKSTWTNSALQQCENGAEKAKGIKDLGFFLAYWSKFWVCGFFFTLKSNVYPSFSFLNANRRCI